MDPNGFRLSWGHFTLDLSARPQIMGIINVTPDSFSDGGDFFDPQRAVDQGLKLVRDGADILDVGGESTRPGSREVSEEEELDRVLQVIEPLARVTEIPISVDTYKAGVAEAALQAGASIINDISAGRFDPNILSLAAKTGVPVILMHMKGQPRTMQVDPTYDDLLGEVREFLENAADRALKAGVAADKIILDPGIGFGKTFAHNLTLIHRLRELTDLGYPLLFGASRKAFLGHILGGVPPKERDLATTTVSALSVYNGAHIVRVHDVAATRQALAATWAVMTEHA